MKQRPILCCPECGTDDVICEATMYFLYRCIACGELFSQEDAIVMHEKSSKFRTKPRRGYDGEDD